MAEEPIRTLGTETVTKLDDGDVPETIGQQHPDMGQVDQEISSEEKSTDASATTITSGSARGARKRMGGATSVNQLQDPYSADRPSAHYPTEPPPRRTRYFPRYYTYPQWPTVQVVLTPAFQPNIDHSHHRTTYGSYHNEGQHAMNHGPSRPHNTYSAGPEAHGAYFVFPRYLEFSLDVYRLS